MQDDRQMFDVDIDCGECGTKITQLPFEPSGDKPVYCIDCLRKRRNNNRGGGGQRQRQMYDVDVNCGDCGQHISQLPFQPRGEGPIYCFDCNKKRRGY